MSTILEELYYGNISPHASKTAPARQMEQFRAKYAHCFDLLPPDRAKELEHAIAQLVCSLSSECTAMFETGFTLGCRIMLEVMEHNWT